MKIIKKITIILTFLNLSACSKSHLAYQIEKDTFNERMILEELSKEEQMKLTYRFRKSLSFNELKKFSKDIQLPGEFSSLSPMFKDNLKNSVDASTDLLAYSDVFSNSLTTSSITTAAAIGLIAMAFGDSGASNIPKYATSYFVPAALTEGLTSEEVTLASRQQTLDLIKTFFSELNYEVICEIGCVNDYQVTTESGYKLWLGNKTPMNQSSEFKFGLPKALEIHLQLKPLVKTDELNNIFASKKSSFMSNEQLGWFINIKSPNPYSSIIEKNGIKYNDLRSNIYGSVINKKFYEFMTTNLEGYAFTYRGKYNIHYHVKEGFFEGKTYALKDTLEGTSIVDGLRVD